jgi:hypothetical protein
VYRWRAGPELVIIATGTVRLPTPPPGTAPIDLRPVIAWSVTTWKLEPMAAGSCSRSGGVVHVVRGYRAGMRPEELSDQVDSRAVPLPEEERAEEGGEDRRAEAREILRDSEQRVGEAARAERPADAARENRSSEETAGP